MRQPFSLGITLFFTTALCAPSYAGKGDLLVSLSGREELAWSHSQKIWEWAEPGYQEYKSSKLLADWLEEAGFRVERGVAEMPTAFIASYGTEGPVIAILGEYDALPGLSQKAVPYREPFQTGGNGHGCGHHLFGVASATAAMAVAERIKSGELKGTVRYYGCPAEEGGAGKTFMVEAGLFKDVDIALHWHPSSRTAAGDRSSLARIAVKYQFRGMAAHAAGSPEQGRSALDAVELTCHAAELLREHIPEEARIHHVITEGGNAPNVVPDFAEVYFYVRHPRSEVVRDVYRRLELCAKAGGLATETELKVIYEGGTAEILTNSVVSGIVLENLRNAPIADLTEEERTFGLKLRETFSTTVPIDAHKIVLVDSGQPGRGSTDVGDVSWVVPTAGFNTTCFIPGTPGHSWQSTACGGTSLARKGMNLAARVLAESAWDILEKPEIIKRAKAELEQKLAGKPYQSLMLPGQKPPLEYRKSPSERTGE